MPALFKRFVCDDAGEDLIEYALLAGFIALVTAIAVSNVGTSVNEVYKKIDSQVQAIPGGAGS